MTDFRPMAEPTEGRTEPARRGLDEPHPVRLPADAPLREEVLSRHRAAIDNGEPGYLDPATGLFVITAAAHLERGRCCGNGCRHCPYI